MQGTIGYIINLILMLTLISSLFFAKKFWSNVTKKHNGIYIRMPLAAWILASQLYWYITSISDNPSINSWFYWELCNIVAWGALILMLFPNKLILELLFPFSILGPILTITVPTQETEAFTFDNFRYYQYFYGHLASLFAFVYVYLYSLTKFKFGWKFIGESMLFAWSLLTFVELWNVMFQEANPNGVEEKYPNYIFRDVFDNINLKDLSYIQQYFLLTYGIGPALMFAIYGIMTIVQPLYTEQGNIKQKFAINKQFYIDSKNWTINQYHKIFKK